MGRIAYFLVVCISPETPVENFRPLNNIFKYLRFSKKVVLWRKVYLKKKENKKGNSVHVFFFLILNFLKYMTHMQRKMHKYTWAAQ